MSGKYTSAYDKFRAGASPIRIETGRYEDLDVNQRFCFNSRKNNSDVNRI